MNRKTLVISDTHLSHRFEKRKYDYLVKLFDTVDEIILNGDFWDGYLTTFDQFINSDWQKLFPLLKEKRAIYIYGNHDLRRFSDERVSAFSTQQVDSYDFETESAVYHLEHGHKQVHFNFDFPSIRMFKVHYTENAYEEFLGLGVHVFGSSFFRIATISNVSQKRSIAELIDSRINFLFGHSHLFETDVKHRYYNSGTFNYGLAQYFLIDNSGLTSVSEHY